MPAGFYNITCEQGATFTRILTWKDSNGLPVNLSGYTARMHVRKDYESQIIVLELTTENGRISIIPNIGRITLSVDDTTTSQLVPSSYVYDLELVSSSGTVTRLVEGAFVVKPEVTR